MTEQQLYNWLMAHPRSGVMDIVRSGVALTTANRLLDRMRRAGYVQKEHVEEGLVRRLLWSVTEKATPWESQEPAAHYGDGLPRVSSVFEYARSMA